MTSSPSLSGQLGQLLSSSRVRRQMVWTAVLVLVALGGAGLATAADRQPTDETRPELTWRAEQVGRPWIQSMASQLFAVEEELGTLSGAGREALVSLPGLDPAQIEAALAEGDASSRRLEELLVSLMDMRDQQLEDVQDGRLSLASQKLLAAIDEAIAVADPVPLVWEDIAADARRVTQLLDALVRHDSLVFRATTAGRQERFSQALELLDQADEPLADAQALRDQLAEYADVDTLDELLRRYAEYDAALYALYDEILRSGTQDSDEVRRLLEEVERAQDALPADTSALRIVVAEAAGPAVAEGLITIEEARGVISDAVGLVP
jgi:tetratricopeptide (TPR) repeat protein